MANFDDAFENIIGSEGGYVNNPADHGGPTNFGITLATMTRYLLTHGKPAATIADIQALTLVMAKKIYKQLYWDAMMLDNCETYPIALILFDQAVNRGTLGVTKIVQISCGIKVDGIWGKQTLGAVNMSPWRRVFINIINEIQDEYVQIAKKDPSQMVFLAGWINRSQKFFEYLV